MSSVAIRDGLFAAEGEPRLLGSRCSACGGHQFPRGVSCPYCGADECENVELSSRGRLYLHTAVLNRPPGYRGAMPFGFGVVELPEGVRLIARLAESDVARLTAGQGMRLVIEPMHRDDEGREVLS